MPYRFDGKVCLITGAASGIGRATAQKMSSLGAVLSLCDINEFGLQETQRSCDNSDKHFASIVDVSKSGPCREAVETTIARLHGLDFVFNCAGVNPTAFPLTETTDEYWDTLVDTNLKGTYAITRAAIPHLTTGGSIVNVSSIMGVTAAAQYAIYCATKWGVVGFTKAMALELGGRGIRVNAIAPGYINTPTNAGVLAGADAVREQESRVAMGEDGHAREIADVVAYLFSDESRYITGAVIEISGGRV